MKDLKEIVWNKISTDQNFLGYPEPTRKAVRLHIEALPEILADILDNKATPTNFFRSWIRFNEYLVNGDYYRDLLSSIPDEKFVKQDRKTLINISKERGKEAISVAKQLLGMKILTEALSKVTKTEIGLSPNLDLDKETDLLYRQGKLTIGDLVRSKPIIFIEDIRLA